MFCNIDLQAPCKSIFPEAQIVANAEAPAVFLISERESHET